MEVSSERKKTKVNLGITCSKYMLFVLNAIFAIASVFMISGGISTSVIFSSIYTDMGDGFRMLSIFWIVVGAIFLFVSLFGIFAAFKESTVLANLYGIAMVLVFVFQIAAAVAGFTLISRSRNMVSSQLETMMNSYSHNYYYYYNDDYQQGYRLNVDWIQSKFECCGVNGPTDWQKFDKFSTPYQYVTPSYYYRTRSYYYQTDDYYYPSTTEQPTTEQPTTTTEAPRTDLMPASCCVRDSNYVNLTCEKYHTTGCFEPIHQIVSESIMTIGSSALVLAVAQILGVVLGFMYARIVRRKKTQRDVQIWNSGQEYSDRARPSPPFTDYTPVDNQGEGEVKYI